MENNYFENDTIPLKNNTFKKKFNFLRKYFTKNYFRYFPNLVRIQ